MVLLYAVAGQKFYGTSGLSVVLPDIGQALAYPEAFAKEKVPKRAIVVPRSLFGNPRFTTSGILGATPELLPTGADLDLYFGDNIHILIDREVYGNQSGYSIFIEDLGVLVYTKRTNHFFPILW